MSNKFKKLKVVSDDGIISKVTDDDGNIIEDITKIELLIEPHKVSAVMTFEYINIDIISNNNEVKENAK